MTFPERRRRVEWAIIRAVVTDAIKMGLTVTVHDGDDYAVRRSADLEAIRAGLFATDEESLIFHDAGRRGVGRVSLVYGNGGWDVIQDYYGGVTPQVVARAERIADRMADTFDTWSKSQ